MKPPKPPPAPNPLTPGSFRRSFLFVLGLMVLAGCLEHLYKEILLPRAVPEQTWFQALALGWVALAGAIALAYRRFVYETLASVRTSVTILSLFALSCVVGSFVLQQRDLDTRGLKGEKAYAAFRLAEAGFVYHMLYGNNHEMPLSENGQAFFVTLRQRFGDKFADERTELFHKMMGGRAKDQAIREFADEHDVAFRRLWEVCQLLRLTNIHRCWAFVTLMTLLSLSLLAGTYKRFQWRFDQIGFASTHMGFFVLMIGFTLSMGGEERGILPLTVGQTLDEVWEFHSQKPQKLGMRVTLEDFYTEHHTEIFTEFLDVDYQSKGFPGPIQRSLKPYVGSTYPLNDGEYKIEVLEYAEYGDSEPAVVADQDPKASPNPAIQIDVTAPDDGGAMGWLFALAGAQSSYEDPRGDFQLSFHWEDEEAALTPPQRGVWGSLYVRREGQGVLEVPVFEGQTFDYDGKQFTIQKVAPDFAKRDLPTQDQEVSNPAVLLAIQAPGQEEPLLRWNFAWIDFDKMHEPAFPEVELSYRFLSGKLDPQKAFRVHGTPQGLELISFDADGKPKRRPVELGATEPLGSSQLTLAVKQLLPKAKRVQKVTPIFEQDFLDRERNQAGWAGSHAQNSAKPQAVQASSPSDPHAGHDHEKDPHPEAGSTGHEGHDHGPNDGHDHGEDTTLEAWQKELPPGARIYPSERFLGPVSPQVRREFQPPGPPAAKLRITHPQGVEERWFLAGHGEAGVFQDGKIRIQFAPNPGKVKEWRSLLVATNGSQTQREVVKVNHTMEFAGWTLYQTDADPKRPNYSGIQVLKDPGWYFIEPGLIMVCLGVIFMFWIQPWLKMDVPGRSKVQFLEGRV